ncbi:MAG TPA: GNAT family N-acetyltransferase, partial [Burkholderiaceae bacterium]
MTLTHETNANELASAWIVRTLELKDIPPLELILREHIRDLHAGEVVEAEVLSVMAYMRGSPDASARLRRYQVACDASQQVIGCMAISTPDIQMCRHFAT